MNLVAVVMMNLILNSKQQEMKLKIMNRILILWEIKIYKDYNTQLSKKVYKLIRRNIKRMIRCLNKN
jgi:hypothetical protein